MNELYCIKSNEWIVLYITLLISYQEEDNALFDLLRWTKFLSYPFLRTNTNQKTYYTEFPRNSHWICSEAQTVLGLAEGGSLPVTVFDT